MRRLLAAAVLGLALIPAASAGGNRADLVLHGGTVWTIGDFGIHAYAASDGRTVYAPQPTSARYDVDAAVAGDALFVASVANGYTDGEITRVDLRTHATRVVWHRAHASAQYVVAGAGGVYVLVGAKQSSVLRLSVAGKVTGWWPIVDAGRIAADASGCWVATDHRILHIRPGGRAVEILLTEGLDDIATGGGAAWTIERGRLTRIDEHTGVVRALRAGGLQPIGANHELAVGAGFLWTVGSNGLQRRNLETGRVERAASIRMADAVAVAAGAVWVATGTDELYRLDPRTLRITLRVPLVS